MANHYIVKIGMSNEGGRAPWLERLGDKILSIQPPKSSSIEEWKKLSTNKKVHLQELLHRELSYSGIIDEEMSYSSIPLAIMGIET